MSEIAMWDKLNRMEEKLDVVNKKLDLLIEAEIDKGKKMEMQKGLIK